MREQRRLAVAVETNQGVPETIFVLGQLLGPLLMAGLDRLRGGTVGEPRSLDAEARALGGDFEAGPGRHPIERTKAERMQHRREGHARIIRKGIAQGQRAVRRELGDEPFRQWLNAVVLFAVTLRLRRSVAADGDNGTLDRTGWNGGGWSIAAITLNRLDRRLVFRTDVTPFDPELALGVDADEHAGARDVGGIVSDGALLECRKRGLDLTESSVNLVRQFVGVCVLLLEPLKLGLQGATARTPLIMRSTVSPSSCRSPAVWPYGKSGATVIHFQPSARRVSALACSFSITRRSSRAGSWSQPPSSCSNRSRITAPPAAS
jgi:hypothetical protein